MIYSLMNEASKYIGTNKSEGNMDRTKKDKVSKLIEQLTQAETVALGDGLHLIKLELDGQDVEQLINTMTQEDFAQLLNNIQLGRQPNSDEVLQLNIMDLTSLPGIDASTPITLEPMPSKTTNKATKKLNTIMVKLFADAKKFAQNKVALKKDLMLLDIKIAYAQKLLEKSIQEYNGNSLAFAKVMDSELRSIESSRKSVRTKIVEMQKIQQNMDAYASSWDKEICALNAQQNQTMAISDAIILRENLPKLNRCYDYTTLDISIYDTQYQEAKKGIENVTTRYKNFVSSINTTPTTTTVASPISTPR